MSTAAIQRGLSLWHAGFATNGAFLNHCLVAYLRRIADPAGLDLEPMLYQVPLLTAYTTSMAVWRAKGIALHPPCTPWPYGTKPPAGSQTVQGRSHNFTRCFPKRCSLTASGAVFLFRTAWFQPQAAGAILALQYQHATCKLCCFCSKEQLVVKHHGQGGSCPQVWTMVASGTVRYPCGHACRNHESLATMRDL